jgi:hypothetical protein
LKPVRLPLRAGTALFSDSYATIDSLLPVSVYHNFRKRVQKQAEIPQNFKDSIQKFAFRLSFDSVALRHIAPPFAICGDLRNAMPALAPLARSALRSDCFAPVLSVKKKPFLYAILPAAFAVSAKALLSFRKLAFPSRFSPDSLRISPAPRLLFSDKVR